MTKKKKKAKRPAKVVGLPIIPVKAGDETRARLQAKADRHAEGNLSAWLRHSGARYTPKKGERVVLKAS